MRPMKGLCRGTSLQTMARNMVQHLHLKFPLARPNLNCSNLTSSNNETLLKVLAPKTLQHLISQTGQSLRNFHQQQPSSAYSYGKCPSIDIYSQFSHSKYRDFAQLFRRLPEAIMTHPACWRVSLKIHGSSPASAAVRSSHRAWQHGCPEWETKCWIVLGNAYGR